MNPKVKQITDRLNDLNKRQGELMHALTGSFAIQAVWPEAWDGGCTVKMVAREVVRTMQKAEQDRKRGRIPELKECYLLRSDGVKHPLTSEVYWTLKELM